MSFDLVVVGAGTMGTFVALEAAQAGMTVLMLDEHSPPHAHGSHHGGPRLFRHAYARENYTNLALMAESGWERLEERSERALLHRGGVLNINLIDSETHQRKLQTARALKLPVKVLGASEITTRWPGFHAGKEFAGVLETRAGWIDSSSAVRTAREAAVSAGVTLLEHHAVVSIHREPGGVAVRTSGGEYSSGALVVAAGFRTPQLVPHLALPVTVIRKVVAWFEADRKLFSSDRGFPAFTLNHEGGEFYGFPCLPGGGVKIGRHDGGEELATEQTPSAFGSIADDERDLRATLERFLPRAAGKRIAGVVCRYDCSPDDDFIIDRDPELEGVFFATGFSGHGFKFAPAIGKLVAEWIATTRKDALLAPFTLSRFRRKADAQ